MMMEKPVGCLLLVTICTCMSLLDTGQKSKAAYHCLLGFLCDYFSLVINRAPVDKTNFCIVFSEIEKSLRHNWWTLFGDKILELSAHISRIGFSVSGIKIAGIKKFHQCGICLKIQPFCVHRLQQHLGLLVDTGQVHAFKKKWKTFSLYIQAKLHGRYFTHCGDRIVVKKLREAVPEFWVVQKNCQLFWHLENSFTFHACTVLMETAFRAVNCFRQCSHLGYHHYYHRFGKVKPNESEMLKHKSVRSLNFQYRNKIGLDHLKVLHSNKICSLVTFLPSRWCTKWV